MLEQYQHDIPAEEEDSVQEHPQLSQRKKFLFIFLGASSALLFFLFLTGIFRGDEDILTKEAKTEMVSKARFLSLEEKVQALSARLERVEKDIEREHNLSMTKDEPLIIQEEIAPQISSQEEAIAITHKAIDTLAKKPPTEKKEQIPTYRTYTVQKGDTLAKISQKQYGTAKKWQLILQANKDKITNINNVKVGTELSIPEDEERK